MISFEGVLWPGELSCANLVAIGSNCSLYDICDIGIFFSEARMKARGEAQSIMAYKHLPIAMRASTNTYGWYF